jgi:uncharacterized protein YcbK (DUF882 family)
MGKISRHFTRKEVACKCGCGLDTIDAETMMLADQVRDLAGHPITPTSAARCEWWNGKEGGSRGSQHPKCRAIDLPVKDVEKVYNELCKLHPGKYGFGKYVKKGFIHVDSRDTEARWEG